MTASKSAFAVQACGFVAACALLTVAMIPSTALPASHPTTFGSNKRPAPFADTSDENDPTTFSADPMPPGLALASGGYAAAGSDPRSVSEDAEGRRGHYRASDVDPEMRRLNAEMAALDREIAETTRESALAASDAAQAPETASNETEPQPPMQQSQAIAPSPTASPPQT